MQAALRARSEALAMRCIAQQSSQASRSPHGAHAAAARSSCSGQTESAATAVEGMAPGWKATTDETGAYELIPASYEYQYQEIFVEIPRAASLSCEPRRSGAFASSASLRRTAA